MATPLLTKLHSILSLNNLQRKPIIFPQISMNFATLLPCLPLKTFNVEMFTKPWTDYVNMRVFSVFERIEWTKSANQRQNLNLNFKPSQMRFHECSEWKINKKWTRALQNIQSMQKKKPQVKGKCEKINANCISYFNGKKREHSDVKHETLWEISTNDCICCS